MLKAQLDLSVPCPHTQDFEPCMGPGCSDEGECLFRKRLELTVTARKTKNNEKSIMKKMEHWK